MLHMNRSRLFVIFSTVVYVACTINPSARPTSSSITAISGATQLVVVTTAGWDSTTGDLHRFARADTHSAWKPEGGAVPIVVGRTGLAWGIGFDQLAVSSAATAGPRKIEGDGRSPAGVFPLDTAFGFAPRGSMPWVHLPYVQLVDQTECVDDTASVHYNTVVDRSRVPSVDWSSSEHMRRVTQYQVGIIVGYNAVPPVKGRGSCIFFHIWKGPRSTTVGCTALERKELEAMIAWLDPKRRPVVVQVPAEVYPHVREGWTLPSLN